MKDDLNVIRCPICNGALSYYKGVSPLVYLLRMKMPLLDCTVCDKLYEADPFDTPGIKGGMLHEVAKGE